MECVSLHSDECVNVYAFLYNLPVNKAVRIERRHGLLSYILISRKPFLTSTSQGKKDRCTVAKAVQDAALLKSSKHVTDEELSKTLKKSLHDDCLEVIPSKFFIA